MPIGRFKPWAKTSRLSALPSLSASVSAVIVFAVVSVTNTSPPGPSIAQRSVLKPPSAKTSMANPGGSVSSAPAGRGTTCGGFATPSPGGGRSPGLMWYDFSGPVPTGCDCASAMTLQPRPMMPNATDHRFGDHATHAIPPCEPTCRTRCARSAGSRRRRRAARRRQRPPGRPDGPTLPSCPRPASTRWRNPRSRRTACPWRRGSG